VYIPRPGEGPVAVPVLFIGTQRVEHVKQFKYMGPIIASDGTVKGEVSRRLGLAYAAFNRLGKQGIWKHKTGGRRTKLTFYKATVLTILLYCAETWSIGPEDVGKNKKLHRCRAFAVSAHADKDRGDQIPPLMLKFESEFGGNIKCLPSEIL
jgi:hypothetical protein